MMHRLIGLALLLLALVPAAHAQTTNPTPRRLHAAILAAGVPIQGVSLGETGNKATWKVAPSSLQAAAQPTIDAFDPADAALATADLDEAVKRDLDNERLTSAVVWVILRQMFPADTVAQTKTKYTNAARPQIIAAYGAQPWK